MHRDYVEVAYVMRQALGQFSSPLKGNLKVLVLSLIFWTFTEQMIATYEPLYVLALGGSGAVLGLLSATPTLFGAFFRILGGYIADTRGRRLVVGVITILTSFSYLFYVFAQDWTWLILGASLLSFAALHEPALEAIRADSVRPEERGRSYMLMTVLPLIPALAAPVVGGLLILDRTSGFGISLVGVRIAYALLFLGMLSAGLIRLFFLKETLQPVETRERGGLGIGVFRDAYETIRNCSPPIRRLVILTGFFMFCFHFDERFRSAYAVRIRHLTTVEWGAIVSMSQIISILAVFAVGWLVDKYGRKKVFVPSIAFLGVSAFLFSLSSNLTTFLVAMVIQATCQKSRIMALQVLMADMTPKSVRGRVFGATNILSSLGSSASIALSGFLYDLNPSLPFYIAVMMYAVATLTARSFLHEAEERQL